ncbi:hypothetical protein [Lysobacter gummosus]|uniref:hypothetical protein n=1 Tax=Lysobacter gummosus TaxID=262324 RepID=UPI00362FEB89
MGPRGRRTRVRRRRADRHPTRPIASPSLPGRIRKVAFVRPHRRKARHHSTTGPPRRAFARAPPCAVIALKGDRRCPSYPNRPRRCCSAWPSPPRVSSVTPCRGRR